MSRRTGRRHRRRADDQVGDDVVGIADSLDLDPHRFVPGRPALLSSAERHLIADHGVWPCPYCQRVLHENADGVFVCPCGWSGGLVPMP